jgi:hypothetical protein
MISLSKGRRKKSISARCTRKSFFTSKEKITRTTKSCVKNLKQLEDISIEDVSM